MYIPIIDDSIVEPRESFEVSFEPRRNFYLRNNIIKVYICDNDGGKIILLCFTGDALKYNIAAEVEDPCICDEVAIQVWFDPTSYVVNENAGTATLTIRTNIAGGPPDGQVRFNTVDGTATGISYIILLNMPHYKTCVLALFQLAVTISQLCKTFPLNLGFSQQQLMFPSYLTILLKEKNSSMVHFHVLMKPMF